MKKIFTLLALSAFAFNANAADKYTLDPHHTSVTWSANHFGFSNPHGIFAEIEGNLILDEKHPNNSSLDVKVKMDNLVTGYINFDKHLKSDDFFNVEKYATATFVSKKIVITGKNTAKVIGDLTLVGITKPVTLNVKLNKVGLNPISQKKTAGFSATATIKRSEFGINYAVPAVSDDVKLVIESEANLAE